MSSEKYEEILEKLGFYLRIGREYQLGFYETYETEKQKPNFHEDTYTSEQAAPLNTWLNEVYQYLAGQFGINHHYLFSLMQGSSLSISKTGWPQPASSIFFGFKDHLDALSKITFRIEERLDLVIRQEIAKQEQDASTKYELRYSKARELTLNGIMLARPDFMSENDKFLEFIFQDGNSWRNVPTQELLEHMKTEKLGKTIHQILSDLSITASIKDVFMPNVSSKGFEFRNPISHGFADENKLPTIDLKSVRSNKK